MTELEILLSLFHSVLRDRTMLIRFILGILILSTLCTVASTLKKVDKRFVENINFHNDYDDVKMKCVDDCLILQKLIVNERNTTVSNLCKNIYSYMCNDRDYYHTNKNLVNEVSKIQTRIADILTRSIEKDDSQSLIFEKTMYHDCMKLGSTKERQYQENLAFTTLYREVIHYVRQNKNWQDFDNKLESLGFGHAFFDISVIRDPENSTYNIILLQPLPIEDMTVVNNKIDLLLYYKHLYKYNRNFEKLNAIDDLYDFLKDNIEERIQLFFQSLLQIRTTELQKNNAQYSVRTTLENFNNFYIQLSESLEIEQINWTHTVKQTFQNVDINITEDANIIVKKKPYFTELAKLLKRTPNSIIVSAIMTKLVTQNLIYIDSNLARSIKINNDLMFCLKETNLYGASHKFIHDSVNSADTDIALFRKMEEILFNVVNVLNTEIVKSQTLRSTEKVYLQYKIRSITGNFFEYIFHQSLNFYDAFEMTPSYFFNIIKYRQMIKNKNLKSYNDIVDYPTPFSINDLNDINNRFMLSVFINRDSLKSITLPKAFHYGNYGVKIAGSLYALINENKLKEDTHYRKYTDSFVSPEYANNYYKLCVLPSKIYEHNYLEISDIITEIFGIRIAYKAMLEDSSLEAYDRSSAIILINNEISMEQLFFLAYAKNQCYRKEKVLNAILFNTESFNNIFRCYNSDVFNISRKCSLRTFSTLDENFVPLKM